MDLNPAVLVAEPAAFAAGAAVLRVPPAMIERPRRIALIGLAGLSAVGAMLAGGAPTGWAPLDVVLCGGVGAACVLAGSRAPSVLILLASAAAAAAGSGSVALPLGLAAVGLVVASLVIEVEPLVDAAAAGLVAQAALRLTSPEGRGVTALAAALLVVPLLVSALRTLAPRHRRAILRVALGAVACAAVGAAVGAIAAASAVGPLRRGLDEATTTIDATTLSTDHGSTGAGLLRADEDFTQARRALEAWWVRPARVVPVVAQHWRVLRAAALTGDQLASSGRRALDAPALADIQVTDGKVPLDRLAATQPAVADIAGRATAARRRLEAARSPWLIPALSKKLDSQLQRIRGIEKSSQLANKALPLLPPLLGQGGVRRYFLAVQTPDESRAGGGFLGNYGEITADDGHLSLTRFGRQDDLNFAPGATTRKLEAPSDYVARYARFGPQVTWSNVNLSPDFPTDAQVMANLYPQSGGTAVDGVIAVDPAGLAALLSVVGTIEVPSWPVPITAANALQTLLYDQYSDYSTERDARIDFLGDVARVAWQRLTGSGLPPVPQLLSSFAPAVRSKHLMFWSSHPDEEHLFESLGGAGKIAPVNGDFIGLVTQNAVGNKIDYFLHREVDYRVQLDPGSRKLQATARISLHNDAPASGLDPLLIGNDLVPRLPTGTNKLYLSFYSPWQLVQGTVDGTSIEFERATELGRQVYSTALIIPPASTVVVDLTLSGRMTKAGTYRLDVFDQPVVNPDAVTTTLTVPSGWGVGDGTRQQTHSEQLQTDAVVEVSLRRR